MALNLADPNVKAQAIEALMQSGTGRSILASSFEKPLRKQRDYTSVSRVAYLTDALPAGAFPVYQKDVDVQALMISEDGQNIVSRVKSKNVVVPMFEIAANPEIPFTEITSRRFNMLERAVDKGRASIQAREDAQSFAIMDALATMPTASNPDIIATSNLTASVLADAIARIERYDIPVTSIFMNSMDFTDLRKWDRDVLDPQTQRDIIHSGTLGSIWNANIFQSRMIEPGTIYVCGAPEHFGRIPVRYDITVLAADDPKMRTVGFSMFENLGMCAFNDWALQRVIIQR